MWVADVVLRRAARLVPITLPGPALPTNLDSIDVTAARAVNIANLDRLEALGRERDLRGGFWRDLMRASEMLELPDRLVALTSHYRAALQRVGAPITREQIVREREYLNAQRQEFLRWRDTGDVTERETKMDARPDHLAAARRAQRGSKVEPPLLQD